MIPQKIKQIVIILLILITVLFVIMQLISKSILDRNINQLIHQYQHQLAVQTTSYIEDDLAVGNLRLIQTRLSSLEKQKSITHIIYITKNGTRRTLYHSETLSNDFTKITVPIYTDMNQEFLLGNVIFTFNNQQQISIIAKFHHYFNYSYIVFIIALLAFIIITSRMLEKYYSVFTHHVEQIISGAHTENKNLLSPKVHKMLNKLATEWKEAKTKIANFSSKEAKLQLAAQVAHDIRSPLSALTGVAKQLNLSDDNPNRAILESVTARINSIAQELLDSNRQNTKFHTDQLTSPSTLEVIDPYFLLKSIVNEKTAQFQDSPSLLITLDGLNNKQVSVQIDPTHFSRLLSNIINNSIEALDRIGDVDISCSIHSDQFITVISDNGPGIPKHILDSFGEKGTTSKSTGNGLGVYHAKKMIESWSGKFEVETSSSGTSILITLPIYLNDEKDNNLDFKNAILLDDDELIHITWQVKAKRKDINLRTFTTPDQLYEVLDSISKNTPFYIDSSLADGIFGEDIALVLYNKGYTHLYLATGFEPEHFANCDFLTGIIGKEPPF